MGKTLLDKIWELHRVRTLPNGKDQIFIGLHLIHEVTSPQAFQMIREEKLKVLFPQNTFATVDHIVPTDDQSRPLKDPLAEEMLVALENNTNESGIKFFYFKTVKQGIVHVIGPELGITQPGLTITCGDSHTSTHGAFGAFGVGVGASQLTQILATQCLWQKKPRTLRVTVDGVLGTRVTAKDLVLAIIAQIGTAGATGCTVEYAGPAIRALSMEGRLTVCNMSIEAGARAGMIAPDDTT